ncbi:MAG TPA: glycosyltransferase family 2 protein [Burkholderiales bacterium]|nr:glycosyltransferase family 2 protein [Burkholderiales bacterium]
MTVSAVIPCYRCADTVRRAALSVAAQAERPLELILVDDASDDGTPQTLAELQAELGASWVQIITLNRNGGAAAARNAGWNAARGTYVAFLDADDSWLPAKTQRQRAFMDRRAEFSISGHLASYAGLSPSSQEEEFREITRRMVLLKNPMVTPSFMVRRDLPIRFDAQSRYMEDHRFLQEAVYSGLRVARLKDVLAVVHKPAYGRGGLSARLWPMERGELDNYRTLRRAGWIRPAAHWLLVAYSLAKFCRRITMVGLRRLVR